MRQPIEKQLPEATIGGITCRAIMRISQDEMEARGVPRTYVTFEGEIIKEETSVVTGLKSWEGKAIFAPDATLFIGDPVVYDGVVIDLDGERRRGRGRVFVLPHSIAFVDASPFSSEWTERIVHPLEADLVGTGAVEFEDRI